MQNKKFAAFAVLLLMLALPQMAFANTVNWDDVNVMTGDGNVYYPAGTSVTVRFTVADANTNPTDVNIDIYYSRVNSPDGTALGYTTQTEFTTALDGNLLNFCSGPLVKDVPQSCSYTKALPANLDGNYVWNVKVTDTTNSHDWNGLSQNPIKPFTDWNGNAGLGDFRVDTNACQSVATYSSSTSDVTITKVCAGYGSTGTIYYDSTRIGICPDSLNATYTGPVHFIFGDFTLCYNSVDSLGNSETWRSLRFKTNSGAYDLAVLVEMLLAALIIMTALGAVVLRHEEMTGPMMIGLVATAVIIAIAILIFATIL